jgi:hypothetical protein
VNAASVWRCDGCGETILADPIVLDGDGDPIGPLPPGIDITIKLMRCSLCSMEMRRVVSPLDLRDWAEQFSFAEPA